MKLSIKPVALAVTAVLASFAAHSQTLPTIASTDTAYDGGSNDGLYLAIWDNNNKATDLVALTTLYSDVAFSGGSSILDNPDQAGFTLTSNPTGSGQVYQLNLGSVSNFSSVFPTADASATFYSVVGTNNTALGVVSTSSLGDTFTGAIATQSASISGNSASWGQTAGATSPQADTTGTASYNVVTGVCSATLCDGEENSGHNFAVGVGTAAGFYNWSKASSRGASTTNVYEYDGEQGFFFLSDAGQLTWNLIAQTSTVPLPPAVWLFASGLLGLVAIGRRRQSGLGAAV
jgi:hypothetical protein